MFSLRFNHVFLTLLILSGVSAFIIPRRFTDAVRAQVQGVFSPVSRPARMTAGWIQQRVAPRETADHRSQEAIGQENQRLQVEVAHLTEQLKALQKLNADRDAMGPLRSLCTAVAVIGGDAGMRQSLALAGSQLGEVRGGQPVLYPGGVAGRIDRAGAGAAQVRLITDVGFRMTGHFGRFQESKDGRIAFARIALPAALVEGIGNGIMVIRNLTMKDIASAELAENDWVVLDDADWPIHVQGQLLGRIISIKSRSQAPLFAEIRLAPAANLLALREVMVLTKN